MAAAADESRLFRLLLRHWWLALLLMGVSFVLFGMASLNLLHVLQENFRFIADNGADALREGALVQLLELAAYGYFAAACYIVFKVCEKALVLRITHSHRE